MKHHICVIVVIAVSAAPAPADFDYADSPQFHLGLLTVQAGGGYDYADSGVFSATLYPVHRGWADSGGFALNYDGSPSGAPGDHYGVLYDLASGQPISGATVSIPGSPSVQTDEQGRFSLDGIASGTVTVTVSKPGYYSITQQMTVGEGSYGFAPITMTPQVGGTAPAVTQITAKYFSSSKHCYYLGGVTVMETVTATIDWNGKTPSQVKWILPDGTTKTDTVSGNTATRTFDMGSIGLGKLSVVVIVADGAISAPKQANCQVIPPPPGIPTFALSNNSVGNELQYAANLDLNAINEGVGENVIPEDIPGFGGKKFEILTRVDISAKVTGSGSAEAGIKVGALPKPMEIAGVKVMPKVSVKLTWEYSSSSEEWIPGGAVGLEIKGSYSTPPSYFVIPVGPIPVPAYWRLGFQAAIGFEAALTGWNEDGSPILKAHIPIKFGAEVMLGVGVADLLAAEGYLGGAANVLLEFPHEEPLRQLSIELNGGIRVVVFIFSYEMNFLHYEWYLVGGDKAGMLSAPMILGTLDEVKAGDFETMGRDYLGPDYAIWSPGLAQTQIEGMTFLEADGPVPGEADTEQLLQYNVFGQSQPTIAADGNDLLLAWVYDDPNRDPGDPNSPNRTEIVFSECREGLWTEPLAIDDDGTADFSPQIVTLPDGNALCVWENAKQWLPDDANLTDMAATMEIAAAHYDSLSGEWTSHALTDNGHLDRTPRIAAAADGTAIAVWVQNETNDILGLDPNAVNTIRYCLWDGAGWSEPNTASAGVGSIIKTSLAYNGSEAVYLYSLDSDYDWQTETDRELYVIVYDGNDWSEPYQLTEDTLLDANPQVAYDQNDLLLIWYRDANLVSLINFDPNSFEEILQTSGSSGSMDFRLAKSPTGQVSLVWTEASSAGVDIFTATYDAGLSVWSKAYQLTSDRAMERSVSASYAGADELALAYNKVEIIDQNGIPEPNRVDLYVLRHPIEGDLAIETSDISLSITNPMPGSTIDVNAVVHNLGDVAEVNVLVAFYEGSPDANGVLIGDIQIIAGPISAGDTASAMVSWLVPEVNEPLEIYVVVDPCFVLEDSDRSNNVASISPLAPDLTVTSISSERIGPKKRAITARVANAGSLPAENVAVVLNRDSASGPELASYNIAELAPNTFQDVWYIWDITTEDFNDVELSVHVDVDRPDEIVETDEENNAAFGLIKVGKMADVTDNGRIDFVDCAKLADSWLEDCSEPEWCEGRDFDKSSKVDFGDLKDFAESWLWQAAWYSK